jgi:4-hydroxy-2-oxoheptanedioate aldolase
VRLRELWDGDGPMFGGWCTIPSAITAEIIGRVGFDWVGIDTQHGLIGYGEMLGMLQALAVTKTPALVRVPWNEPGDIMKALDAGAAGVIIPMVNSPEEASQAVAACHYPPRGYRSWGPTRAALHNPAFSPGSANDDVICAVMLESVSAVDSVDDILKVEGIDGVFIGPADLALSAGLEPNMLNTDPAHLRRIERIAQACKARGIVAGISGNPKSLGHWHERGFRMLGLLADAFLLRQSATQMLESAKQGGLDERQEPKKAGYV